MISSAVHFLLQTVLNILTMMFLVRFLMQAFKTPFHNPIGQIVIALTDFAVKPIRRFIPSWKKTDLSTLLLALMTQLILQFLLLWLRGFPFAVADAPIWSSIFGLGLLGVVRTIFDVFFYAIFLHVILSWVNPNTAITPVLNSLTRPILAPIQKLVPAIGGIDFSPFIAIILLQMLNISVFSTLEKSILSGF
ncbi:MAG: YggT family protein [Methylophilaceae bacterium]